MYERHEEWMTRYGKVYKDPEEREKRFRIFKENVNYIETFNNAANKPYQLGTNQFADLTNEEFTAGRNRLKGHMCSSILRTTTFKYENVTAIPSTVDWRQKGAVTPVKDQGQCGKQMLHSSSTVGCVLAGWSRLDWTESSASGLTPLDVLEQLFAGTEGLHLLITFRQSTKWEHTK